MSKNEILSLQSSSNNFHITGFVIENQFLRRLY